jgi:hypothetical protein
VRKPYEQKSAKFQWFIETKNRHHARWNFWRTDTGIMGITCADQSIDPTPTLFFSEAVNGIFGHCTHPGAARIAQVYWQRYNTRVISDGCGSCVSAHQGAANSIATSRISEGGRRKYHIHHVNSGRGVGTLPILPMKFHDAHDFRWPTAHPRSRRRCRSPSFRRNDKSSTCPIAHAAEVVAVGGMAHLCTVGQVQLSPSDLNGS